MTSGTTQPLSSGLIGTLSQPQVWPHNPDHVEVIETHISWIVLTGEFAYKIKRPLDLGFLDFTTLESRRDACLEEVRLNRRTAPMLYLGVVAICGTPDKPRVVDYEDRPDDVIEYAVRMRQFPQHRQLDEQLAAGELEPPDMLRLAEHVASFHQSVPQATADDPWNGFEHITRLARENFVQLEPLVDDAADTELLVRLREWTRSEAQRLRPIIAQRHASGFVREVHGDLHLSNLVRLDQGFAAFDCIEFDPALRWMDVMAEVGFVVMDIAARHRIDLAWRFLNRYLELTGDYPGVALLRFYIVYASMVRAKVAAIHAEQEPDYNNMYREQARLYRMHLGLAQRAVQTRRPLVLLTHGLSGSGKSWLSRHLASALPAVRMLSDVERKRLHGLEPLARTKADPGAGIYDAEATNRTYDHLLDCTNDILAGSFDVIVDATFLTVEERKRFINAAREAEAQLLILECNASESVLRERIMQREWDGGDASEANWAVLQQQKKDIEPLTEAESRYVVSIDTSDDIDPLRVTGQILSRLGRDSSD